MVGKTGGALNGAPADVSLKSRFSIKRILEDIPGNNVKLDPEIIWRERTIPTDQALHCTQTSASGRSRQQGEKERGSKNAIGTQKYIGKSSLCVFFLKVQKMGQGSQERKEENRTGFKKDVTTGRKRCRNKVQLLRSLARNGGLK